jgi:hypothetical protein
LFSDVPNTAVLVGKKKGPEDRCKELGMKHTDTACSGAEEPFLLVVLVRHG